MGRLNAIPATLIYGRRDISGPAVVAWRLRQAWPASELLIEEHEGHGGQAMTAAWNDANARHGARILQMSRQGSR